MSKNKKSGPAIFMYCVIVVTIITWVICFSLYYGNIYKNNLWYSIDGSKGRMETARAEADNDVIVPLNTIVRSSCTVAFISLLL